MGFEVTFFFNGLRVVVDHLDALCVVEGVLPRSGVVVVVVVGA